MKIKAALTVLGLGGISAWAQIVNPGFADSTSGVKLDKVHISGYLDTYVGMGPRTAAEFDVLLLGAGLAPNEESALKSAAESANPPVPVVAHYGGGSGLLFAEVWGVLGR